MLFCSFGFAQTTFNIQDYGNLFGTQIESSAPSIPGGYNLNKRGEGLTWDFSSSGAFTLQDTATMSLPDTSQYFDQYPQADILLLEYGTSAFFDLTSDGLEYLGLFTDGYHFPINWRILPLPAQIGTINIDTLVISQKDSTGGSGDSVASYSTLIMEQHFDGAGTLISPVEGNTYQEVLKAYTVQHQFYAHSSYTDSTGWILEEADTSVEIGYWFYMKGHAWPLATITYENSDTTQDIDYSHIMEHWIPNPISGGLHTQNSNLQIRAYPSVAHSSLSVDGIETEYDYSIIEAGSGIVKATGRSTSNDPLDISDIATGNYIVLVNQNGKISSSKFVK